MKLLLDTLTNKILNYGEPPWSNTPDISLYNLIEIKEVLPEEPLKYFYINNEFIKDNTPTQEDNLKAQIKSIAQSSVGVSITSLNTTQIRSLLLILLNKEGAIDSSTLKIKPLNQWATNEQ